ncbi:MAG TPA: BON domain-containing protein [Burkholderiaceae bacterium]|nr:BON domain-containing protein [Burkholderiaceae bacterium]
MTPHRIRLSAAAAALSMALLTLGGCAAVVLGGAVGTALVAADRRTAGTQLEDQNIELKSLTRIRETVGERGHVNVTSYNRQVLITGEVASDADRSALEQSIARIEGVRTTVNELAVMGVSSMTARSNDTILTSKVKASLLDAKDMPATAVKVVTERGTVYLMGRVSEREATRATEIARGVAGVQKVVRVFEILTEAELATLGSEPRKN